MSYRTQAALWIAQRASAAVLAVCVVVHLITIIYAVQGGLTAAEILARTRGSIAWGTFYSVFVIAAAIHGAIGLRTVAAEWLGIRGDAAELGMSVIGLLLTLTGLRAVAAVVA